MDEIWKEFSQTLNYKNDEPQIVRVLQQINVHDTPKNPKKSSKAKKITGISHDEKDIEITLAFASFEIVLNIKKIPPLDIFYIPQHKVVVKRGRKKRKLD